MPTTSPQTHPSRAAHSAPARAFPKALRPLATVIVVLLLAQFVVGMIANLYVQIPRVHPGTRGATPFAENLQQTLAGLGWALAHGALALRVHVALGLALDLASLALVGLAIAARSRAWIIVGVIGFLSIAGAGANGVAFLNAGGEAINSLAMAIDFLLALVAYGVGLYRTHWTR